MKSTIRTAIHLGSLLLSIYASSALVGTTELVSMASDGSESNGASLTVAISANGRYVAFQSNANNLVADDTNGQYDIFIYDRNNSTTERVSISSNNTQANSNSGHPSISADGRYVAFHSLANNLVANDTNGSFDIFVHDRNNGTTERLSVTSENIQGGADSQHPSISADGRYVAFHSLANNLVVNDTNDSFDIFVQDRNSGITERVSISSDSIQGEANSQHPSISSDGRYVVFHSLATNLVTKDINGAIDIFVYDRNSNTIELVNVANNGSQANDDSAYPSISADGRYVAFDSIANNLVTSDTNGARDVFIHDRSDKNTERVSVADDGSQGDSTSTFASISADGRYVAFTSFAVNLVANDTTDICIFNICPLNILVHDRNKNKTERVSVASNGTQANDSSYFHSISANGRYVAFSSDANNLVTDNNSGYTDIFVYDRGIGIDSDSDGVPDDEDNCPTVQNPGQEDSTPAPPSGEACADEPPDGNPPGDSSGDSSGGSSGIFGSLMLFIELVRRRNVAQIISDMWL